MYIEENESRTLPEIDFDETLKIFKITGRSISNDATTFFEPILEHFQKRINHLDKLEISINLEYFNTRTARSLLELFKIAKKVDDLVINWYYDEEDDGMLQAGTDYEEITNVKFNFIKKIE